MCRLTIKVIIHKDHDMLPPHGLCGYVIVVITNHQSNHWSVWNDQSRNPYTFCSFRSKGWNSPVQTNAPTAFSAVGSRVPCDGD
jgi:hypothetical protein